MAHIPTEIRRRQLIDAAMVVIARDGVDGATTRRIADEAGAPLAALHYCFQTKQNLLWAVFEAWKGLLREARRPLGEAELESVTRVLVAIIDGLSMQLVTHGDDRLVLREVETTQAMVAAYLGEA